MSRKRDEQQDAKGDAPRDENSAGVLPTRSGASERTKRRGKAIGKRPGRERRSAGELPGVGLRTIGRISDFRDAEYNPRKIEDVAAAGLRQSLKTFGDLSSLVVNRRTGNVVCGHQRRAELSKLMQDRRFTDRIVWGSHHRVELGESGRRFKSVERSGFVTMPGGARFTVRLVDWPIRFEKAANVAANATTIQGEFTDALDSLLAEIRVDHVEVFDDLMLSALLDNPKDGKDDTKETDEDKKKIAASYQVVIECKSEKQQKQMYRRLKDEGFKCRVLTL